MSAVQLIVIIISRFAIVDKSARCEFYVYGGVDPLPVLGPDWRGKGEKK